MKEAIEPSGSLPPNPGTGRVFPGRTDPVLGLATGGWLAGVRVVRTVAPAAVPSLLAEVGSGVAEVLLAVLLTLRPAGAMNLTVLARALAAPMPKFTGGKVTIPVTPL